MKHNFMVLKTVLILIAIGVRFLLKISLSLYKVV